MTRVARRLAACGALLLLGALLLPFTVSVWMDEEGHTYLTDQGAPTPGARELKPEELRLEWRGRFTGRPLRSSSGSSPEDRFRRELATAQEDLERGEVRLGLDRLRRLHSAHPNRPEPSWLLAQAERKRGRLESAAAVLDQMLSTAAPVGDPWREAAQRFRGEIHDELALTAAPEDQPRVSELGTEHFRILYDHAFAGRRYGQRAASDLELARTQVEAVLGRTVERRLNVHLYTKGRYLKAYQHRFGFATVGFYDGAIHVVSAQHPQRELRALLVHEYVHAVFEDVMGGHQPFFLNEGIADREEERTRGRSRLAREDWRRLLDAIRGDSWIPLPSIVQGFSGLEGRQALLAYLESRAVIELIESERPGAIGRWLAACADGMQWESALERHAGWTVLELNEVLRQSVLDRFPVERLASLEVESR